jgi:hypothetical protein
MKRIAVAIAATTLATMGSAQAGQTTFSFDYLDDYKTSILKSLDGITLKMENFTPGPRSYADGDGFAILAPNLNPPATLTSFTMTFDQPVKLLNYNLSYLQAIDGTTTTYSQNPLESIQTYTTGTGLQSFNNQFIAQANVPILVTSNDTGNYAMALITSLTVEKVDPVPGPLPMAGAAAAFSWSRRLRGRIRRTARV